MQFFFFKKQLFESLMKISWHPYFDDNKEKESSDEKAAEEFQKDFEKLMKANNLVPMHGYNDHENAYLYKIIVIWNLSDGKWINSIWL